MRRAEGWEGRLRELIDGKRFDPFAWGSNDCCTFARDCYRAMMGEDPAGFPTWSDRAGAAALLAEKPLVDWITAVVGLPRPGYAWARRGDLVQVGAVAPGVPAELGFVGVAMGPSIACLAEPTGRFTGGLVFTPIDRGILTWQIGD